MFTSRYSDSQKQEIVRDRVTNSLTVRAVCEKYNITPQTFYAWQRRFETLGAPASATLEALTNETPETENKLLRQLYIELSAHNYQLAKFLEK